MTRDEVLKIIDEARNRKERPNLGGADLRCANLYGANLYCADLRGADLYGADLGRAYLYGADLRGADLYGADLGRAYLYGADLYGADLGRAYLYGADLYDAKNIWHALPGGSRGAGCAFVLWDDGIHVFTGCFGGTLDKFLAAVEITHGDTKWGRYYRALVECAKIALEEEQDA